MDRNLPNRKRLWSDDVGELLRLLAGSDIEEIEVEHDGARVVVKRDLSLPTPAEQTSEPRPSLAAPSDPGELLVTSPLVGIFRMSPGATGDRAVRAGDQVEAGQVVGAVEAMRLMNRVQSDVAGVLDRYLVEDGDAVEFGQPLVLLRPG